MPNGKPTPRELCLKLDALKEQNDKEHSQILERLDRIETKLDNFSEFKVRVENAEAEIGSLKGFMWAGVAGLIGWLITIILFLGNLFFGNR